MDQREIGRLLVKITGLIVICYALIGLPDNFVMAVVTLSVGRTSDIPSFTETMALPEFWGMSLGPFLIYLAVGLGLFRWAEPIVDRIVVRSQSSAAAPVPPRAVEEIAVAVLGLYFFAEGLADATRWIAAVAYATASHHQFEGSIWPAQMGIVGSAGMRLILGIILIVGNRGVVTLRRRLVSFRPMAKNDTA